MGINRISIFLHAFASSSGVSVGGASESSEPGWFSKRCSKPVVDSLAPTTAIRIEDTEEERKGRERRSPQRKIQHEAL